MFIITKIDDLRPIIVLFESKDDIGIRNHDCDQSDYNEAEINQEMSLACKHVKTYVDNGAYKT